MLSLQTSERMADSSCFQFYLSFFGLFLGLCLLKFGNPPIMEKYVDSPGDGYQLIFGYPWPIAWAYRMLALVALLGIACVLSLRRKGNSENTERGQPCPRDS